MPMQPRPMAETSSFSLPSLRVCISRLLQCGLDVDCRRPPPSERRTAVIEKPDPDECLDPLLNSTWRGPPTMATRMSLPEVCGFRRMRALGPQLAPPTQGEEALQRVTCTALRGLRRPLGPKRMPTMATVPRRPLCDIPCHVDRPSDPKTGRRCRPSPMSSAIISTTRLRPMDAVPRWCGSQVLGSRQTRPCRRPFWHRWDVTRLCRGVAGWPCAKHRLPPLAQGRSALFRRSIEVADGHGNIVRQQDRYLA